VRVENPYFQFCGEEFFQHRLVLDRSSLTRWRKRMAERKLQALPRERNVVLWRWQRNDKLKTWKSRAASDTVGRRSRDIASLKDAMPESSSCIGILMAMSCCSRLRKATMSRLSKSWRPYVDKRSKWNGPPGNYVAPALCKNRQRAPHRTFQPQRAKPIPKERSCGHQSV
jgi:hypothetical protein